MKVLRSETGLQSYLDRNNNSLAPPGATSVGVYFQFAHADDDSEDEPGRVVAIGISTCDPDEEALVLWLRSLSSKRVSRGLKALLGDSTVTKVMYNVHRTAYWLDSFGLHSPQLHNCIDLQLLFRSPGKAAVSKASILDIINRCFQNSATQLAQTTCSFKASMSSLSPAKWTGRGIPMTQLQPVVRTAELYASCYEGSRAELFINANCAAMTSLRWKFAATNKGCPAIWFDPELDNQPRSLECLVSPHGGIVTAVQVPNLELECDLNSLLSLLPVSYRTAILALDNYRDLVDICIDTGRVPIAYTGRKQRVQLCSDGTVVPKTLIDEILLNLGGEERIGSDNRAGIDGQLHRISVLRSKRNEVYGFTMRVGRALRNAACVLTDLLLSQRHATKSVLVLGYPGCGKTTLIRDMARCVAESMENVCIIDTSNEIGGDGLVPHACVGWARRMMVRSLEAQASVMIECVQNHTVETLVVDEIGRKAEVLAASTVRQRGPRIIASAHGDFRALVQNADLKGLVGGSQQVTLGDALAKVSSNKNKVQTQRAGKPIFDVIVELDPSVRGRCRIIWDVAAAVDTVLEGARDYVVETRQWDMTTRGVQMLS
uniref:AAA+ ATPase domain-containing protein n=1 Tax=Peronospora matthiolae TaxID=2874970 RepID=A0AAV1UZK8_9STRA